MDGVGEMVSRNIKQIKPEKIKKLSPWEKQPHESPPAFQAFVIYRDQGLGNRSTARVSEELGKSLALIHRWSGRWQWVFRVESYDEYLDQQIRDRHLRELNEA